MATMKAVRIRAYGGPDVLKYEEAPRPTPGRGEVLIQVHAAGVNPVDWKIRAGYRQHPLPLILGRDVAGVIESTGSSVKGSKMSDQVYGRPDISRDGAYDGWRVPRNSRSS
jgi:NADPH:quinone reductase-like Zn-dependent oxidoreductase